MNCMKCGREIREGQVFCDDCLQVMAKYPVKPGIAIQLPQKKDIPYVRKAPRRKPQASPEERIRALKKRLRTFVILWLITLALLAAATYPALKYFLGERILLPGQNYSTFAEAGIQQP